MGSSSARALLVTIVGEYVATGAGGFWTTAIVDGLGLLGVEPKAARQALGRVAADGWLTSEKFGRRVRWTLSPGGRHLFAAGLSRIGQSFRTELPWDGQWLLLFTTVPEPEREVRHRLRARLSFAGFGSLGQGVWISPHVDAEADAAEILAELGAAGRATSFAATFGEVGNARDVIGQAWDLDRLRRRYEEFLAEFADVDARTDTDAFVARTRIVHAWRHLLSMDPGLPPQFLPRDWPADRARKVLQQHYPRWVGPADRWWQHASALDGPELTKGRTT